MATESLIFEIKATAKGFKVVRKDIDAVADGVERTDRARKNAGKSQDNYNRREKGIFQSNLSSAKGFSKMNQAIGSGSSGLVGAYATLAANVFAATAAFDALRRAAQLESVAAGLKMVGAAAGRNLTYASERLQEVSGYAVSTDQAMRSMALGISSGFSTAQMEKLTIVARGASIALGRDMTDALDRLTRGVAKLEPEILDELGIMVRLDDATEKYATTLGKTADDLTQFERVQAFMNATAEQGIAKFGALAEKLDPNPYDRLAAALSNLQKEGLTLLNKFLIPFISALSNNMGALIGVITIFGSTISKQLVPFMYGAANSAKAAASEIAGTTKQTAIANIAALKGAAGMKAYGAALADGTDDQAKLDTALRSSTSSIGIYKKKVADLAAAGKENTKEYKTATAELANLQTATQSITHVQEDSLKTKHAAAKADALENASRGKMIKGFKHLRKEVGSYHRQNLDGLKTVTTMNKTLNAGRTVMYSAGTAARFLGTGFMAMLGPIGLLVSVVSMLWPYISEFFQKTKTEVQKTADEVVESFHTIQDTSDSVMEVMDKFGVASGEGMMAGFRGMQGILSEIESGLNRIQDSFNKAVSAAFQLLLVAEAEREVALENAEKKLKELQELQDSGTLVKGSFEEDANKGAIAQQKIAIQSARDAIAAMEPMWERHEQVKGKMATKSLKFVLNASIKEIQNSRMFKEGGVGAPQVEKLKALRENIGKEGLRTMGQLDTQIKLIRKPFDQIVNTYDGLAASASEAYGESNKLASKETTRFSKTIEKFGTMAKGFEDIRAGLAGVGSEKVDVMGQTIIQNMLEATDMSRIFGREGLQNADLLGLWVAHLKEMNADLIKNKAEVKLLGRETKEMGDLAKRAGTPAGVHAHMRKEEQLRKKKLEGVNKELQLLEETTMFDIKAREANLAYRMSMAKGEDETNRLKELGKQLEKDKTEEMKKHGDLLTEQKNLEEQKLSTDEKAARVTVRTIEYAKKLLDIKGQSIQAQKTLLSLAEKESQNQLALSKATGGLGRQGIDATAADELRHFNKFAARREELLEKEMQMTKDKIDIEEKLMKAKLVLLREELKAAKKLADPDDQGAIQDVIDSLDTLPNEMAKVYELQRDVADQTLKGSKTELKLEKQKLRLASLRSMLGEGTGAAGSGSGIRKYATRVMNVFADARAQAETNFLEKTTKEYQGAGLNAKDAAEAAQNELDHLGPIDIRANLGFGDKAAAAGSLFSDSFAQLASLGTEQAPIFEALANAGTTMTANFSAISDLMGSDSFKGFRDALGDEDGGGFMQRFGTAWESLDVGGKVSAVAAGVGAVAGAMSSVFGLMAAKSKMQEAAIDRQIASAKKMYGGTKKGEQMIAALEKKKEAQKKKSFDLNKKMMIAQTIMATAMGVMNVWADPGGFGPVFRGIMTGFVLALGAAQLAIISGMSYQGGGSAGGAKSPPSISVGSRSNKVDVAGSRAGGELGYMRGERGRGTSASDFTRTAFVGAKYRATGGAAYVVGEQGPELFVPEVPGQIMANDEADAEVATPNVTFNINAIDAANMEETLVSQRGNIINMIREAANNQGETFLEGLDTMALGDSY